VNRAPGWDRERIISEEDITKEEGEEEDTNTTGTCRVEVGQGREKKGKFE
jgi:hypothetical protein